LVVSHFWPPVGFTQKKIGSHPSPRLRRRRQQGEVDGRDPRVGDHHLRGGGGDGLVGGERPLASLVAGIEAQRRAALHRAQK
jgi:hypothetical protein